MTGVRQSFREWRILATEQQYNSQTGLHVCVTEFRGGYFSSPSLSSMQAKQAAIEWRSKPSDSLWADVQILLECDSSQTSGSTAKHHLARGLKALGTPAGRTLCTQEVHSDASAKHKKQPHLEVDMTSLEEEGHQHAVKCVPVRKADASLVERRFFPAEQPAPKRSNTDDSVSE